MSLLKYFLIFTIFIININAKIFIIEDDLNLINQIWEKTSLEKWAEKGENGYVTIKGLSIKADTPFHYLAESLSSYCDVNNINDNQCITYLTYFKNEDEALQIEKAYKAFFNNNYYTWLMLKDRPAFPYSSRCYDPQKCYENIKKYMFIADLEDSKRVANFMNYIQIADTTTSISNTYFQNKNIDIAINVYKYAKLSAQIYNAITEDDIKSDSNKLTKVFTKFIANELFDKLPILGKPYGELFSYGIDLTESWTGSGNSVSKEFMQGLVFPITNDYKLNSFFYLVNPEKPNISYFPINLTKSKIKLEYFSFLLVFISFSKLYTNNNLTIKINIKKSFIHFLRFQAEAASNKFISSPIKPLR